MSDAMASDDICQLSKATRQGKSCSYIPGKAKGTAAVFMLKNVRPKAAAEWKNIMSIDMG